MKLAPVAQNALEWIGLRTGLVPIPLAYAHFGFLISKFLLEAVDKGIFEAIGHQKLPLDKICSACNLNERAVESLLGVLATMNLIKHKDNLYWLPPKAKKWILKDSPNSLYWLMMFDNKVCFKWMDYVGSFLSTGKGLQYHDTFNEEEWFYYQKAMEASATLTAGEAARKIRIPSNATRMLDIGGAHGLYSVALCKRYHGLTSTILDLPGAVKKAAPILEKYGMGSKVTHTTGNVLTDPLGLEKYDVVIMASVAHHFTAEENQKVAKKVYDALKPGGIFTIMEVLKTDRIKYDGNMLSAVGDFFFALSSTSGTWRLKEMQQWQSEAGFKSLKKATFLTIPGYVALTGFK